MRRALTLLAAATALMLAACNTVEGLGRDVSAAGSAVAKTAAEAKR